MKKFLLLVLSLLFVFCLFSYLFIPGKLSVKASAVMPASENGTHRFLFDSANWRLWWNYSARNAPYTQKAGPFTVSEDTFRLVERLYKSARVTIQHNGSLLSSEMVIIPLGIDSTGIEWTYTTITSIDPLKRVSQYFNAAATKKHMDAVLSSLQIYLSKKENVYGIGITRTSTTDTLLITSKVILPAKPHTPGIYDLVKEIQAYAQANGAKQSGNPIYNITMIDSTHWQLMAAVPVNKEVTENDRFAIRRMVRGSFMVTEVVGGEYSVDRASRSLQQFFADYRKTSMAISFNMLITDRLYQPDTTRWITKLYQPVY